MKRPRRAILCVGILANVPLLLLLDEPSARGQAVDPQLEKILADWQKRQEWVKSIRYRVSGKYTIPKGVFNSQRRILGLRIDKDYPSKDMSVDVKYTLLLDFENGRHRFERDEPQYFLDVDRFCAHRQTDVFNGSTMKQQWLKPNDPSISPEMTPPPTNPDVPNATIISGNMKNNEFELKYRPIFFGHGRVYTIMDPIIPGKLLTKPDPDYFSVHGNAVHEGRNCVIVRTQTLRGYKTSFTEYWVDIERTSAIVRTIGFSGDKPGSVINIQYKKTSVGWMPDRWKYMAYPEGKVARIEDMHVVEMTIDPHVSDSDFQLVFEPGTIVEERKDEGTPNILVTPKSTGRVYRLEEANKQVDIPDAYGRKGFRSPSPAVSRHLFIWIGLLPLVLCCIAIWVYWRKKHYSFISRNVRP